MTREFTLRTPLWPPMQGAFEFHFNSIRKFNVCFFVVAFIKSSLCLLNLLFLFSSREGSRKDSSPFWVSKVNVSLGPATLEPNFNVAKVTRWKARDYPIL